MNGETDKWQIYKPHYFPFNLLVVVTEKAKYDHLRAHLCMKYYSNWSSVSSNIANLIDFVFFLFFYLWHVTTIQAGLTTPVVEQSCSPKLAIKKSGSFSVCVGLVPLPSAAPFFFSILKTNTKTIPKPNTHLHDLTDKSNLEASRFSTVVYVHRMLMLIFLMLLIF